VHELEEALAVRAGLRDDTAFPHQGSRDCRGRRQSTARAAFPV